MRQRRQPLRLRWRDRCPWATQRKMRRRSCSGQLFQLWRRTRPTCRARAASRDRRRRRSAAWVRMAGVLHDGVVAWGAVALSDQAYPPLVCRCSCAASSSEERVILVRKSLRRALGFLRHGQRRRWIALALGRSFVKRAAALHAKYRRQTVTGSVRRSLDPSLVAAHPLNRNGVRVKGQRCQELCCFKTGLWGVC